MPRRAETAPSGKGRPPTQGRVSGRLQREYRYYKALLGDPRTPTTAKWLISGGVGYALLPLDLIPDFIPIIGKLDDILIAPALIGLGMKLVPEGVKSDDRGRSRRIRVLYDDETMGPVLFESAALPGPFGIRIGTCGRDIETQGPILFPLLDLMYEYGLVVTNDNASGTDRLEGHVTDATTDAQTRLCKEQVQLDVNFRPLPVVAAIMYCNSKSDDTDHFVNTHAAYLSLSSKLRQKIEGIKLRWRPCSEMRLDAALEKDDNLANIYDTAHTVSGAQFLNLLMNENCSIVGLGDKDSDRLIAEVREYAMQDQFCYAHGHSDGELIAWNPRQVLHVPSKTQQGTPRFVYPRELRGETLGRS